MVRAVARLLFSSRPLCGDVLSCTLTSSFLIGGGCNERSEFVELLVDGDSMMRATGGCQETMFRVHWDLRLYSGRTGQVRIVDASSDLWGHINVDDFRFDWALEVRGRMRRLFVGSGGRANRRGIGGKGAL